MKHKDFIEKFLDYTALFMGWGVEVSAFILLPLIIYAVAFLCMSLPRSELMKLPEWMFIAIILYGETIKRLIVFYKNFKGFEQKLLVALSFGLVGITLSSVLLCFSLIAEHQQEFILPKAYYDFQALLFIWALSMNAYVKIWIGSLTGEAALYRKLQTEDAESEESTNHDPIEDELPEKKNSPVDAT